MRSLVQLANSNCPWCLNDMVGRLRAHPGVRGVKLDMAAGCVRVDHDGVDVAELVAGIRGDLRAWDQAGNGELVIVEVDAHPTASCPHRPPRDCDESRPPQSAGQPSVPDGPLRRGEDR